VLQRAMYSNAHGGMPPPQSRSVQPETFLLDQERQQSLPADAVVALHQVDNCTCLALSPVASHVCLDTATRVRVLG
jgi:hypothetical protein